MCNPLVTRPLAPPSSQPAIVSSASTTPLNDLGSQLADTLRETPDTPPIFPGNIQTDSDPKNVTSVQRSVNRLVTGGIKEARDLAEQDTIDPDEALTLAESCYARADADACRELDDILPDMFGKALSNKPSTRQALHSENNKASAAFSTVTRGQTERLMQATTVQELQQVRSELAGTREILKQLGQLGPGEERLLKAQQNMVTAKLMQLEKATVAPDLPPLTALEQKAGNASLRQQEAATVWLEHRLTKIRDNRAGYTLEHVADKLQRQDIPEAAKKLCVKQIELFSRESAETAQAVVAPLATTTSAAATLVLADLLRLKLEARTLPGENREKAIAALDKAVADRAQSFAAALDTNMAFAALSETQRSTLNTTLMPVVFHEGIVRQIAAFGSGLAEQLDTLAQGLKADATDDQRFSAMHAVDMLIMDNPGLADKALTIKTALLGGENAPLRSRMEARHMAVLARSACFAGMDQQNPTLQAALQRLIPAESEHPHIAALSMKTFLADTSVAQSLPFQSCALSLINAAWLEQMETNPDTTQEIFLSSLPERLQTVARQVEGTPQDTIGLATAGLGSVSDVRHAQFALNKTSSGLNKEKVRTTLHTLAETRDPMQAAHASHMLGGRVLGIRSTAALTNTAADAQIAARMRARGSESPANAPQKAAHDATMKRQAEQAAAVDIIRSEDTTLQQHPVLKEIMAAQGVTDIKKLAGETLVMSLKYLERVLVQELKDLADQDMEMLGLYGADLQNRDTVLKAFDAVQWESQSLSFAHGVLLHTAFKLLNPTGNKDQFIEFCQKKKVQGDLPQAVYNILNATPAQRRQAVNAMEIVSNRKLHMDFTTMRTETLLFGSGKDAQGEAFRTALANYTSDSPEQGETDRKQILDTIHSLRDKTDVVLLARTHGQSKAASENMTHALKKVSTQSKEFVLNKDIERLLSADYVTLLGMGERVHKATTGAQLTFLRDTAVNLFSMSGDSASFSAKQRDCVQKALFDTFLSSASGTDSKTGTFEAFGQRYTEQLKASKNSILKTAVCVELQSRLEGMGMTPDEARVQAFSLLLAVGSHLPETLEHLTTLNNGLSLLQQLTSDIPAPPGAVQQFLRAEACTDSANVLLENLKPGSAVILSDTASLTVNMAFSVGAAELQGVLSGSLNDALTLTRNDAGKPLILLGASASLGAGLKGDICNAVSVGGSVQVGASTGVELVFSEDALCAAFMAKVLTNSATQEDLANVSSVQLITTGRAGAAVEVSVDIGNLLGAKHISLDATASAAVECRFSRSRNVYGETATSEKAYQISASLQVGLTSGSDDDEKELLTGNDANGPSPLEKGVMEYGMEVSLEEKNITLSATYTVKDKTELHYAPAQTSLTGATWTTASSFTQNHGMELADQFMANAGVPEPMRQSVQHLLTGKAVEDFSLSIEHDLAPALLAGETKTVQAAAADRANYQLSKVVIDFAEKTVNKTGGGSVGFVRLDTSTSGSLNRTYEFWQPDATPLAAASFSTI